MLRLVLPSNPSAALEPASIFHARKPSAPCALTSCRRTSGRSRWDAPVDLPSSRTQTARRSGALARPYPSAGFLAHARVGDGRGARPMGQLCCPKSRNCQIELLSASDWRPVRQGCRDSTDDANAQLPHSRPNRAVYEPGRAQAACGATTSPAWSRPGFAGPDHAGNRTLCRVSKPRTYKSDDEEQIGPAPPHVDEPGVLRRARGG